jgi:elongation factor G
MPRSIDISKLRNIGITAHIDAGKTTTTERILYYSGFLHKIGEVDDGTAFMDYMEQERERGITITAAAVSCFWNEYQINIVDTPGHVDFTAEVQRSLRVLDGAIAIFCAVGGVEPQSETVWHQANLYHVPRIAYINKMDRTGANFENVLFMMKKKLHSNPIAIQIPIGAEDNFAGIIDLIEQKAIYFDTETEGLKYYKTDIPEDYIQLSNEYRNKMIEIISEYNDDILLKYLDGIEISTNELKKAIRNGVLSLQFVPVLCGASAKNIGVQPLIDAIIDYLPSPLEVKYFDGYDISNLEKNIKREPKDNEHFSALAFKILFDPFVERLTFLRIYSGTINVGDNVYNPSASKREKISKVMRIYANRREEINSAYAGDIIAVPQLRFTKTGDTLCDEKHPIIYEKINFAEPVINQAIEARTIAERDKMLEALNKLSEEDPTFKYKLDEDNGQIIISGVGELHLEIITDRLKREFKIQTNVGKPQVNYRETISKNIIRESKFERTINNKNIFGKVKISIEPTNRGEGIIIENNINDKNIPKSLIESLLKTMNDVIQIGPNSYQETDIKATLLEIEFNDECSSDIGYKNAVASAIKDALRLAQPIILEPIFKIEIMTPEENLGDVIADLNTRRGRVEGIEQKGMMQNVKGLVPLSEMFGYITKLRSKTQGRAGYVMFFSHYEPVEK